MNISNLRLAFASTLLVSQFAFAADKAEHKNEETTTSSKNYLTGTKTIEHKHKRHAKNMRGEKVDTNVKETIKKKKDGTVNKSVKVEGESTEKR